MCDECYEVACKGQCTVLTEEEIGALMSGTEGEKEEELHA